MYSTLNKTAGALLISLLAASTSSANHSPISVSPQQQISSKVLELKNRYLALKNQQDRLHQRLQGIKSLYLEEVVAELNDLEAEAKDLKTLNASDEEFSLLEEKLTEVREKIKFYREDIANFNEQNEEITAEIAYFAQELKEFRSLVSLHPSAQTPSS